MYSIDTCMRVMYSIGMRVYSIGMRDEGDVQYRYEGHVQYRNEGDVQYRYRYEGMRTVQYRYEGRVQYRYENVSLYVSESLSKKLNGTPDNSIPYFVSHVQ